MINSMLFTLLVLSSATEEGTKSVSALATPFVEPWNIPSIKVNSNCSNLCKDWATPYFSFENGCIGLDGSVLSDDGDADIAADAKFCPDKAAIKAWTVQEEMEFEALYEYSQTLEDSELQSFQEMTVEREMKLTVHPWQMILQNQIHDPQDRRRIQGSARNYHCFGGSGGGWRWYERGVRPTKLRVRSGRLIDRLEFTYANNHVLTGGGSGGGYSVTYLPSCTTIVLIKSGSLVDGIQFLSQGYETRYYGGSGGGTKVLVAPRGKCLGDIKMKSGRLVDRICLKFNA